MREEHPGKVRIDKWLWAARFFKTRALAAEAVQGGRVHINGQRVKPSRAVAVGDQLEITKGPLHFSLRVEGVSERRGPAKEAEQLYQESEASRERRQREAEQRRLERAASPTPEGRPDKRGRQRIIRFRRSGE